MASSRAIKWRAILITLPIVALLLGLGTWQLQRLQWKESLLAEVAAKQNAEPVVMLTEELGASDLSYRRAILSGLVDRGAAYKLWPRTHEGKSGYHWLVPMVVATANGNTDKPGGILLLVDLGWVPQDYVAHTTAVGDVETISGTLRLPTPPNDFTPPNPDGGNVIYSVDTAAIAAQLEAPVFPYVLEADKTGDQPPIGGQTVTSLPNNHLQYAITWFLLAACVVVIAWLAVRRTFAVDHAHDASLSQK